MSASLFCVSCKIANNTCYMMVGDFGEAMSFIKAGAKAGYLSNAVIMLEGKVIYQQAIFGADHCE